MNKINNNKGDKQKMKKNKYFTKTSVVLLVGLMTISGCSSLDGVGKSARKMTTFSSQQATDTSSLPVNSELIIPPSLKSPANASVAPRATTARKSKRRKVSSAPKRNYFVIVGTYPDQELALDTFVRLSSIGLPGATMESRKTKSGKKLHMVRLGPYHQQGQIDKVTNSLTSDGLSQFKVVEN